MPYTDFMINRRPILNAQLHVAYYKIQSGDRNTLSNHPALTTVPHARWSFTIFDDFPLERLVGKLPVFFAYSPSLFESPPPLSRQQTIIHVPNSAAIDATTLHSLMKLRAKGFGIALDDFLLNTHTESLAAYADVIGVDIEHTSDKHISEIVEYAKLFGVPVMAKNIANYTILEHCIQLGFDLFEGEFLIQPHSTIGTAESIHAKQALIETISVLHDSKAPLDKIERTLAHDKQLSQKILSLVNSAATGVLREVESLRQAIMLIGLDKIKNISNLLILTNIKNKPHELTILALTRAHLCEALSVKMSSRAPSDSYFTVGLLSTFDAFLDEPLTKLLHDIGVQNHLLESILEHSGNEGRLLSCVKAYERGLWDKIDWDFLDTHQIDSNTLSRCYLESLEWVDEMMRSLGISTEH